MRPSWTRPDRPLRPLLTGLGCALLALLPVAAAPPAGAAAPASAPYGGPYARAMLRELNRVRAAHHLPALSEDRHMDGGAAGHSRDMARHGYFAHGAWAGRVIAAAGRAHNVGEVIGWRIQGSPGGEARALVRDWLASPPHRRVLLDGDFRRVGIGRAITSRGAGRAALYTIDWASAG